MKRLAALAGLFLACAGPVTADYLFIKIDLNKVNFDAASGTGQGGQPGVGQPGIGAPGGFGQPGIGAPGLGAPGMSAPGGGAGLGGGFGGGIGGFGGGKGFPGGGKGFPGGGKGFGGAPPAVGPGGAPPAVGPGGGAPPAVGPGGGAPPAVGPGGGAPPAVGPGGFGQGQFGPQGGGQTETPPHYIYVCLEVRSKVQVLPQRPVFEFDHRFGRKGRFLFQELVKDMVEYTHVEHPSNLREFNKKYAGVVQEAKDATGCYLAASYALSHGLTKEFHNAMAALIKADPKHYAAVNYQRVAAELKKAPSGEDRATQALINELKADGGYKSVTSDAGHYVLLTRNDGPLFQSANKRRLARLEEALENFFYWFALQENGPQPTIPNYRLYAVLVDDRQSFFDRHLAWGGQPMVADSFTPRRDSLIVLSAKRLDDDFTLFDKKMQELTQRIVATTKIGRDEFISGAIWDRKETAGAVEPLAAVQTLLLIHKAMEDEAERAAISHEATRQLLFASGLLPRMVHVPEWIQTGLASYFDTPYGALFSGVGLPSWSHLIAFNYYRKDKERLGVSFEALMRTISDRYFRDLRMAEDDQRQVANNKEKQDDKGDAAKVQREVAQSSAWALTYYLLYNKKLPQLMRYLDEIAHLPRDLEIDDKVLQSCFGRAFDLMDRSNPRQLDLDRVRLFARDWYSFMDGVHLKVQAAEDYYRLVRYTPRKKATNQFNQPGLGAGGFAPPGGIGPGGIAPPGVGNPGNLPPPGGAAPGALPPPGGLAPPGGLLKPGGGER